MFIFKKKKNKKNNNIQDTFNKFRADEEEAIKLFDDFSLRTDLSDEIFLFMYRNILNMKDTMIVASYLRQVEVSLEEVQRVYSLSNEYINSVITNIVPELRVKANDMISEIIPNASKPYGWDNTAGLNLIYSEFVDRIEYIFEVDRNQKKIQNELNNDEIVNIIKNNSAILILLNYFSVRESLIIAFNLGLIDELLVNDIIDISSEQNFNSLLSSSDMDLLKNLLIKRIKKLENIEPYTSYFEYEELTYEYENLLEAINDSKEYISSIKKR